jgi:transposase-like protein
VIFILECGNDFAMPQVQLPIFPAGVTHINSEIAFEEREGTVYYFNGHLPVFVHEKSDLATFRLFSTQLVINGNATQAEISRAFGVPLVTVKRYVTTEVCQQAQDLLDQGLEVPEVGRQLGILANTLHKAIRAGRLRPGKKKIHPTMS